jgi:hypothetical protein
MLLAVIIDGTLFARIGMNIGRLPVPDIHTCMHIVILKIITLCGLVDGSNISSKRDASVFRVEVSKVWKVAGYTEEGGEDMQHVCWKYLAHFR